MEVTTLVRTVGLDLLKPALPQRQLDGHKGTFGKLLIVGGAVGYTGAPYLTASAAVRTGCGLGSLGGTKTIGPFRKFWKSWTAAMCWRWDRGWAAAGRLPAWCGSC